MRKASTIKIGETLQALRKSYGYTQEKMAEKIEVSTRYIGDIEQDRAKPSYEILIKICNLYNIGLNQIFSEYLDIKENKILEYGLTGYQNLEEEDKKTIEYLINYFNNFLISSNKIGLNSSIGRGIPYKIELKEVELASSIIINKVASGHLSSILFFSTPFIKILKIEPSS